VVGSVRSVGKESETRDNPDWGNLELSVYDLASGRTGNVLLHRHFEQDDHDVPAFLALPDGRLLAIYSKHAVERKMYFRFSISEDFLQWSDAQIFEPPGGDKAYAGDNVTYSNPFLPKDGRIHDFHRGFSHDPNYIYSDDMGKTWQYGGRLLRGRDGYSPYLKYAWDAKREKLHFVATEDHPRNFDNSLYHGYLKDGVVYQSNGERLAALSTTTEPNLASWDLTKLFQGDPDNVAWMCDIELDTIGNPYVAFSVQKDGRGLPSRQGGMDIRYHYARWTGTNWIQNEMAHAGTRLYPFEDDYSGLAALHPFNPWTVFISTDADPLTGDPLISKADGKRHDELFQGKSSDEGKSWNWSSITANSTMDNLRPLVPKWNDPRTALVWMRGIYTHNHGDWTTAVVALILPE